MKKILILAITLIGTLALTGCNPPKPVGTLECASGDGCEGSLGVAWEWKSSNPTIDLNLSRINLSGSNVSLLQSSGTILVSIKNSAKTVVASSVFNWYSAGNKIYPTDPNAASTWLNSHLQNGDTILFDISGVSLTRNTGINTLVAMFEYGTESIGVSDSFYFNNADLNGF